jgi:ceramide glucosyltransferase
LGIPHTWSAMALIWLGAVSTWMLLDRAVCNLLQKCASVDADDLTPGFARGTSRPGGTQRRPFGQWLAAWIGREGLALQIWTWAVLLGTTVSWRGKSFKVRRDMTVIEVRDKAATGKPLGNGNGKAASNGVGKPHNS